MSQIRGYIISVIAAAIICAILQMIFPSKYSGSSVMKLICGAFVMITVISPLKNIQIQDLTDQISVLKITAQEYTDEGVLIATQERQLLIKEQTETYITNKAKGIGITISAQVQLNQDDIPVGITISGSASPYKKQQVNNWITQDIGIPEAEIIWT